jgi:mannose/fructose-specific phosphotransferase system component IIA
MRELVWSTLHSLKDSIAARLGAHARNAEELCKLREKVWALETQMRVVNVYQHNAERQAAGQPIRVVTSADMH